MNDKILEQANYFLEDHNGEMLYHATYKNALKKIKEFGLGSKDVRKRYAWDNNLKHIDHVFFAYDPDVAESYAESSDTVPDEWLDNIIIFGVNINNLDKGKIVTDPNIVESDGSTVLYMDKVPFSSLVRIK